MIDKGTLGEAFSVKTGIQSGEDRKHSLREAVEFAQVFLKARQLHLIERGFDCPAAQITVDDDGKYSFLVFDADRGFIPDSTDDQPVVYPMNAAFA